MFIKGKKHTRITCNQCGVVIDKDYRGPVKEGERHICSGCWLKAVREIREKGREE